MQKKLTFLTILCGIVSLLACSGENDLVTVFLDKTFINEHQVFLNDTTLLKTDVEENYVELVIPAGKNTLTIDGVKETINVRESGGILNVAKDDFYLYPIVYGSQGFGIPLFAPVVFDSMIVYDKKMIENQESLLSILQDSQKKRQIPRKSRKISKEKLYIKKAWDIGLQEEIPEQIESTSSSLSLDKIVEGRYFLLIAQLSEEYAVEKVEKDELIELLDKHYARK